MSDPHPEVSPRAPDTESPRGPRSRAAWVLPTITGVAGFLLGVTLVGGIVTVTTAVGAAQNNARVAAAKASKAKLDDALKSAFTNALSNCNLSDGPDSQLGDGGYTLTINNEGDTDLSGISVDDLSCLIDELNTPSSVRAHLEQTTSLDGRQSETWGNITMSWSYHPDRGLDAVYQIKH